MSHFVEHQPCPKCGSKDNLGEYTDHWFCFGCKYTKRKNDIHSIRERLNRTNMTDKEVQMLDNFSEIPRKAMQWLLSYGISKEEIDEHGITWSNTNQLLVLIQSAKYWQGRSFDKTKPKYMSSGQKPYTIYGEGKTLVLVEDVVSAMKVCRLRGDFCAMPLLGSTLSYESEQRLITEFSEVCIWLDRDKAINALKIKRRLKARGVDSRVIVTDNDPKEYSKGEIQEWLKSK